MLILINININVNVNINKYANNTLIYCFTICSCDSNNLIEIKCKYYCHKKKV